MIRNYEAAVKALNSCQTNASVLEMLRKSGNSLNMRSIPEMQEYLAGIGYQVKSLHGMPDANDWQKASDLDKLNVLHVAGTKGKGSTAAFCESILRRSFVEEGATARPLRTGLFTSPHLTEVRERIRINGVPISRESFAKYFFEIWDRLSAKNPTSEVQMPGYFRFLFLMACEAFVQEKVDVAIMECGIGGTYDATNVLENPVVSAIASLGFDHMGLLGETLPEIAWHKAGIMKKGVPAFTIDQRPDALQVLKDRAVELCAGRPLTRPNTSSLPVVIGDTDIAALSKVKLGISGDHQYLNAALAVAACKEWVAQRQRAGSAVNCTDELIQKGLELTSWPGRSDILTVPQYPSVIWHLDGAHTPESLNVCAKWFNDECVPSDKDSYKKVLIFSCTGNRSVKELLEPIAAIHLKSCKFDKVVFCGATLSPKSQKVDAINFTVKEDTELLTQKAMRTAWQTLTGSEEKIEIFQSVDDAVASLELASGTPTKVLTTGSLHLVGSIISLLNIEVR
ncbi:Folylpolyglutamate synthetase [Dinochytrium kinnereticum]|nr:Folylpolyglutamate synthetase [Dinochytrium kinnereticum]